MSGLIKSYNTVAAKSVKVAVWANRTEGKPPNVSVMKQYFDKKETDRSKAYKRTDYYFFSEIKYLILLCLQVLRDHAPDTYKETMEEVNLEKAPLSKKPFGTADVAENTLADDEIRF